MYSNNCTRGVRTVIPKIEIHDKQIYSFIFGNEISLSIYKQVRAFDMYIQTRWKRYIVETNHSYHIITVFFNRDVTEAMLEQIIERWKDYPIEEVPPSNRKVTIPVCYEEPFCLDMERVSELNRLTRNEIIDKHSGADYLVYLVGFLPGFPYLGGLKEELATPRLATPRKIVDAGSVGIGGAQTGIYPVNSPGGWNIIGKTPIQLYDVHRTIPFLLQPGDQLKFHPISHEEFVEKEQRLLSNKEAVFEMIQIEDIL